jgi:hypothetical protein
MKQPNPMEYMPIYGKDMEITESGQEYQRLFAEYQTHQIKAGRLVVELLTNSEVDVEVLLEAIQGEHRTHQQCAARTVRRILEAMAQLQTDGRNEATVRFAMAALAATENIGLPLI